MGFKRKCNADAPTAHAVGHRMARIGLALVLASSLGAPSLAFAAKSSAASSASASKASSTSSAPKDPEPSTKPTQPDPAPTPQPADQGGTETPSDTGSQKADPGSSGQEQTPGGETTDNTGAEESSGNAADPDAKSSASAAASDSSASADAADKSDESADPDEEDEEDKEDSEKDDEEKRKRDAEAKKAIAEAQKHLSKAEAEAGKLPGLLGTFEAARSAYASAVALKSEADKWTQEENERMVHAEADRAKPTEVHDEVVNRLANEPAVDLADNLRGANDEFDPKAFEELLKQAYEQIESESTREQAAVMESCARLARAEMFTSDQVDVVEQTVYDASNAAMNVEVCVAEMQQHDKEAAAALDEADSKAEGVADAKKELSAARKNHDAARKNASAVCGDWYDQLDEAAGVKGIASYGVGCDFALDEETFVEKWGAAIDSYYASYSGSVGREVPLSGYGKTMAKAAYAHHIDPRLCAAVSVLESSAGLHCIKSCNAWGWGAADSDPYGLASSWETWEEAIEAWHEGMATNGAGLATAPSLTALGAKYASSGTWAQRVASFVKDITSHVQKPSAKAANAYRIVAPAASDAPAAS